MPLALVWMNGVGFLSCRIAAGNFVNDFRQELPFVLSFPQYFKSHNMYETSCDPKVEYGG